MKFRIPFAYVLLVLTLFTEVVFSQTNQKVSNGSSTQPALFLFGCNYTWTNDRPDVGLKTSGNGDIPAFTAINNTKLSIVATITATPISSASFAYIANFNTSTVTVLNTNNNTIVKKILIGVTPLQAAFGLSGNPRNVTVNKKCDRVYVSNQAINSISIIDAQTNTLLMNVPVGQRPAGLVLSPDDQLLYVCNEDSNNVMVLDAVNGNLIRTIPTDIGVRGILLNPSGSILYAAHVTLSKVSVISAGTGQLLTAVNVGRNPQSMAVTPDGKILYVANYGSESVTVVNTADHTVRTTIAVPGSPNGFAMAPDGKYLYETGIF